MLLVESYTKAIAYDNSVINSLETALGAAITETERQAIRDELSYERSLRARHQAKLDETRDKIRILNEINNESSPLFKSTEEIFETIKKALKELRKTWDEVNCKYNDSLADMSWVNTLNKEIDSFSDVKAYLDGEKGDLPDALNQFEMAGDPVNMQTGNYAASMNFLHINVDKPIDYIIYYNSRDLKEGRLGKGWSDCFDLSIIVNAKEVVVNLGNGNSMHFKKDAKGIYRNPVAKRAGLRKMNTGSEYIYKSESGRIYHFFNNGKINYIEDDNNRRQEFSYNDDGRLMAVSAYDGISYSFSYDAMGHIIKVTDRRRSVNFSYNNDGLLETIIDENGNIISFSYDECGRLISKINPRKIASLTNEYDENGRTIKQILPCDSVYNFDYNDIDRTVTVTEPDGNKVEYTRDYKYRNVSIKYASHTEHNSFNVKDELESHTDGNGNVIRYTYDEKHRMNTITNPCGDTISMKHNIKGLVTEVSLNGKKLFSNSYDAKGNLLKRTDPIGREISVKYDNKGQAVGIIQPDGSEITIERNEKGLISAIIGPDGTKKAYEYDAFGNVSAYIDALGRRTSFSYDNRGNIIRTVNAVGNVRTYKYDKSENVTELVDFDGRKKTIEYTEFNKPAKVNLPDGGSVSYVYNKLYQVTGISDNTGKNTEITYDDENRVIGTKRADGENISYKYDANGNRTEICSSKGKLNYKYDACDRPVEVSDDKGNTIHISYNDLSQITQVKSDKAEYNFAYNAAGELLSEEHVGVEKKRYEYDIMGHVIKESSDVHGSAIYTYDKGGRLVKAERENGFSKSYTYDACGNMLRVERSDGVFTEYKYDDINRITDVINARGPIKHLEYDPAGFVTAVVDGNGNRTEYSYNKAKKIQKVTDALGYETEYSYDMAGMLTKLVRKGKDNSSDRAVDIIRNKAGQVVKITDESGLGELFEYDDKGRLIKKSDRNGEATLISYTDDDLIDEIRYADGKSVKYSFDPLRNLMEINDWLGTTRVEAGNRGTRVEYSDGSTVAYEDDEKGRLLGMTYPDGGKTDYEYGEGGRLTCISSPGNLKIGYEYYRSGKVKARTYGDSIRTEYEYDCMGLIKSIINKKNGEVIDSALFDYDACGNRISADIFRKDLTEACGKWNYEYDPLNRLRTVAKDNKVLSKYYYDEFGNRTKCEKAGKIINYRYNNLDELIEKTDGSDTYNYKYDANGGITAEYKNGGLVKEIAYGANGRISLINDIENDIKEEYIYNGLGQRVKTITNGVENSFVSDIRNPFDEVIYSTSCRKSSDYIWDGGILGSFNKEGSMAYLRDDLGSLARAVPFDSDIRGNAYAYDEFGESVKGHDPKNDGELFGYCGYLLTKTGGYYVNARNYIPGLGRFNSCDIKPGLERISETHNRYIYCLNKPLQLVDRDGLSPFDSTALMSIQNGLSSFIGDMYHIGEKEFYAIDDSLAQYINNANIDLRQLEEEAARKFNISLADTEQLFEKGFEGYGSLSQDTRDSIQKGMDTVLGKAREITEENIPGINKTYSDILNEFCKSETGRAALSTFGFRSDKDGTFHVERDCWQIEGGYNDLYDEVFQGFTSAQPNKISFYANMGANGEREQITLWSWKGDYFNLGAGGETGIYKGTGYQTQSATDHALPMKLTVKDPVTGKYIVNYSSLDIDTINNDGGKVGNQWWITGFNPNFQDYKDVDKDSIVQGTTIDFSGHDMEE